MSSLLKLHYQGPLRVIMHTLAGVTEEFTPNLIADSCTLFDYLGHSCACISTNMTTRLVIEVCADDWEIIRFSAAERTLEVRQIGGEPLGHEPEDMDKYHDQYGYPDEMLRPFMSPN